MVHDSRIWDEPLHGDERSVWADKGYVSAGRETAFRKAGQEPGAAVHALRAWYPVPCPTTADGMRTSPSKTREIAALVAPKDTIYAASGVSGLPKYHHAA